MKKLILMSVLAFAAVFLFSNSCTSQVTICDVEGNLLVEKSTIIEAFNSISSENAMDIIFSYNESNDVRSLLFLINDAEGIAFELSLEGDKYIINKSVSSVKHECSSTPCNSCQLNGDIVTAASCKCLQQSCRGCMCNHTVSTTIGGGSLIGDDLEQAIMRSK